MVQENYRLEIIETDQGHDYWTNRPFLTDDLKRDLRKKDILIIPNEEFRDIGSPVFPVGTEELLRYLSDDFNDDLSVDVCIGSSDYKELALHSALIIIGGFLATAIIAPILVNRISSYIEHRYPHKTSNHDIRLSITIKEESGAYRKLDYEGPADLLEESFSKALGDGSSK